jgi:hypothetical protein
LSAAPYNVDSDGVVGRVGFIRYAKCRCPELNTLFEAVNPFSPQIAAVCPVSRAMSTGTSAIFA